MTTPQSVTAQDHDETVTEDTAVPVEAGTDRTQQSGTDEPTSEVEEAADADERGTVRHRDRTPYWAGDNMTAHYVLRPIARKGRSAAWIFAMISLTTAATAAMPTAHADNKRLNDGVIANVYTVQHQSGCENDLKINPQLRLAAQRHAVDVLNNRALDGDVGSDDSTPQDRAEAAGYPGRVAETVAINPAVAISGIELINQWYYNPAYLAIMRDCAYTQIGVWSENSLDRTVVVAVYGSKGM